MSPLPALRLTKDLRRSIRLGHPWIFDRAVDRAQLEAGRWQPGDLARITYRKRDLAIGIVDPNAPIAVRILEIITEQGAAWRAGRGPGAPSRSQGKTGSPEWAAYRAEAAARLRARDPSLQATNAIRLIHGENDAMPGLVADLYDDTAVVVFDGAAADRFWRPRMGDVLAGLARAGFDPARVWARGKKKSRGTGSRGRGGNVGHALRGDPPPDLVMIHEHGVRFEVDVRRGQKTGLFLDQRDNRRRVAELARDAQVLNLFAYTGGFSAHAAVAGARRVTSVDIAAPAMAAAARNFTASGIDPAGHRFITADCFDYLARAARAGERWDLVIVDPPSLAPSQKARPRALDAYRRLNRMAIAVTARGGWLVTASCSSHVAQPDLLEALAWACERGRRRPTIVDIRGASSDHPTRPGFPEGRYLDLIIARIE